MDSPDPPTTPPAEPPAGQPTAAPVDRPPAAPPASQRTAARRWFRSVPGKLVTSLGMALLLLAGSELVLRVALGPPPPPVRVFSGVGPIEDYLVEIGGEVHPQYATMAPVAPFPAVPDGPRAAVLGGSSVHGGSTRTPITREFPALLAKEIGLDVLNLGNPSLDSHDVARITGELLGSWQIHALVVYTGHNDFANAFFHERYSDLAGGLQARLATVAERSQLVTQLRLLRRGFSGVSYHAVVGDQVANLRKTELGPDRHATAVRYLETNLRRVAWLCRHHGVPLLLVTPACQVDRPPLGQDCRAEPCATTLFAQAEALRVTDPRRAAELYRRARDLDPIPLRAPQAAVDAVRTVAATEPGVHLIDAEAQLPRPDQVDVPAAILFDDLVHFSPQGHREMAKLIAPSLREALGAAE